jgi:hypothetical protein
VESDGLCLIEKLMETLDEDELEVEVTVARKIWLCRNYVVYGGSFYPPSQVAQSAKEAEEDFIQANKEAEQCRGGPLLQERRRYRNCHLRGW